MNEEAKDPIDGEEVLPVEGEETSADGDEETLDKDLPMGDSEEADESETEE